MNGLKHTLCLAVLLVVTLAVPALAQECKTLPIEYQILTRTQQPANLDFPVGSLLNQDGEALFDDEGLTRLFSNDPDFSSLIVAPDGSLYMVTQFESPQPSMIYVLGLTQDKTNGKLSVKTSTPVDLSSFGGAWTMCAGAVTPWGTHLGGEEYEPDARIWNEAPTLYGEDGLEGIDEDYLSSATGMLTYLGLTPIVNKTTIEEAREVFNPYLYGYAIEVEVGEGGNYTATKWFTTGRTSKELVYVMPDETTAYITDDGDQVGFFKFVMDKPGDLSSVTMYAAKMEQTSDVNGGSFDISWIELGKGTQEALQEAASNITFSDIFTTAEPTEDGACPEGFTATNQGSYGLECLQLVEGQEEIAAFLETRRYAALKGATTQFSKWEGITYSPSRKQVFTAMSEIRKGMEDNMYKGEEDPEYDVGTTNDVKVPYNSCGCIYVMDVEDDSNIKNMKGMLCGSPQSDDELNTCSIDGIANPDNVAVLDDQDVLMIGEDTGSGHQNDVVWSYNLNTGELSRIFSTPFGSETTSPYFYPNITGFSYMTAVVQHPYGESDEDLADTAANPYFDGVEGYLGYWVMPAAEVKGKWVTFEPVEAASTQEEKSTVYGTKAVEVCPKGKSGATFISEAPVLTPPSKSDSAPSSVAPSPAPKSSASMSSKVAYSIFAGVAVAFNLF